LLKLGKLPDYGLVIATLFVGADNLLTTSAITQRSKIPLATVRKLLKSLVDAGLIVSHRGSNGGYQLAHEAQRISIAEIIEAIDGPIILTECAGPHHSNNCALDGSCQLNEKWCELNREIVSKLRSISLEEFAS
tara:strand:- start:1845 stop:2246 length:402 start_codon:yes stop_codon:yes gene_type:complete